MSSFNNFCNYQAAYHCFFQFHKEIDEYQTKYDLIFENLTKLYKFIERNEPQIIFYKDFLTTLKFLCFIQCHLLKL